MPVPVQELPTAYVPGGAPSVNMGAGFGTEGFGSAFDIAAVNFSVHCDAPPPKLHVGCLPARMWVGGCEYACVCVHARVCARWTVIKKRVSINTLLFL